MGLLAGITKAAGTLLGGDTIKDGGNIIDNLHTSKKDSLSFLKPLSEEKYFLLFILSLFINCKFLKLSKMPIFS